MGCRDGYISLPKQGAPERFSIQTGLICNLFGITHPLCRWVDEILPSLPVADIFKDVGKQIAKQIRAKVRGKINWSSIDLSNMDDIQQLLDIRNQINQTNNLIDAIIDTMQGGEVSTLEFCLFGKPEFPDPINWGDVFLAFAGLYPDFLISKISGIVAYEKYFEYCECKQLKINFPLPDRIGNLENIPTGWTVSGTNTCKSVFETYLNSTVVQNNAEAVQWKTKESWENVTVHSLWIDMPPRIEYGVPFLSYEFFYCAEDDPFSIEDEYLFDETRHLGSCCILTLRKFERRITCPSIDIRFTYQIPGEEIVREIYLKGQDSPAPCLNNNSAILSTYFYLPRSGENVCYETPPKIPVNKDVVPINPIQNPCDLEFAENFQGLCPECPPVNQCQVHTTEVRIIRNCEEFLEPRSLYLP